MQLTLLMSYVMPYDLNKQNHIDDEELCYLY